jgi:hypothetical protein
MIRSDVHGPAPLASIARRLGILTLPVAGFATAFVVATSLQDVGGRDAARAAASAPAKARAAVVVQAGAAAEGKLTRARLASLPDVPALHATRPRRTPSTLAPAAPVLRVDAAVTPGAPAATPEPGPAPSQPASTPQSSAPAPRPTAPTPPARQQTSQPASQSFNSSSGDQSFDSSG